MKPSVFKPIKYSKQQQQPEESIGSVGLIVHKFNNRPKPDKDKVLIICCFSEFGCEVIGSMYCIPRILQSLPGYYTIVVGWYGREYLYKYLVDEYWELKEEYQHLRDSVHAFGSSSKNLLKIEKEMSNYGKVIHTSYMGNMLVGNYCKNPKCRYILQGGAWVEKCPKCGEEENFTHSMLSDHQSNKKFAVKPPYPSKEKLDWAREKMGKRAVGVFARGRKTYGRNLQPDFYVKLIEILEKRGYTPVWLGEKQSIQPCPVDHIYDFSAEEKARDLETTLAVICNCEFTVQFWTASTRLAGIVGVPWLLFETPDQIFAKQEGVRQAITTFGEKKLCLCDFKKVYDHNKTALELFERCIKEMEEKNYNDVIGLVENEESLAGLMNNDFYNLRGN